MRKVLFIIFILISSILTANAEEKINVSFSDCVDGDTAKFVMNEEIIKVRFLAIDTPESVHPTKEIEAFGKEASDFTCDKIKNAKKIQLEFDANSSKTDKYERYLAWVWVDDYLLQDLIISNGFGEVAYLYGDYKYTDLLKDHEEIAKSKKIGMWNENIENSNKDKNNIVFYCICILILIILFILSKKFRKKTINKVKRKIKKELKDEITKEI